MTWFTVTVICITENHEHVLFVVVTKPSSFRLSWLIIWYLTRVIYRMTAVEQKLLTLPEHLLSSRVLVWCLLLNLYVLWIVIYYFVLISIHCNVSPFSIYGYFLYFFQLMTYFNNLKIISWELRCERGRRKKRKKA